MYTVETLSRRLDGMTSTIGGDCMAQQRTRTGGKKLPATVAETDLNLVCLELPSDVHQQFRVEAARVGISRAAMARRLVEEWTARRKSGGK
jgi:hypothetical protein